MKSNTVIFLTLTAGLSGFLTAGCDPKTESAAAASAPEAEAEAAGVRTIGDAGFDQTIAKGITLVDFWAPWCGPCRMQGPIVERVAEAVGAKAVVAKVNVDDNPATAGKFEVVSIPTLIVFKDGKPVKQFVGVQSEETLTQAIESAAGNGVKP